MVIFNKLVYDVADIEKEVLNCSQQIKEELKKTFYNEEDHKIPRYESYMDYVDAALHICHQNIPSPYNISYPACYNLNLGNNYFTLRIPNAFGFGLKVFSKREKVCYEISLVFDQDKCFIENSSSYISLTNNEWSVREK